jgi:hypothetical protein
MFAVGVFALTNIFQTQKQCLDWARNGDFQVIEGNLKFLERTEKNKTFSVNGITFKFGRYDYTGCGYKASGLSFEEDGRQVRISHRNGNILRFEMVE